MLTNTEVNDIGEMVAIAKAMTYNCHLKSISCMRNYADMIGYTDSLDGVVPNMLNGFFVGWPNPPSSESHRRILEGSDYVELAIDGETGDVIGFITLFSRQ